MMAWAQRKKRGRSTSGMPIISAITIIGSGAA
jgi:hypothetical protein